MSLYKFDVWRTVSVIVAGVVLALSAIAISAPADAQSSEYEKATKPTEALVGAWDFADASAAMAKLKFSDKALTDRLAGRRDEVKRLTTLKTKIIEKANKLKPWLRRGPAVVPGTREIKTIGVQITNAGEKSVTVTQITVRDQTSTDKPWSKLNNKEVGKLLKISIAEDSTDDQLAAGLLALVRSDATAAEAHFDKAKSLGAKIEPYLGPLAAAAFARANNLLDAGKPKAANVALTAIEKKYAGTPWLDSNKEKLKASRARITEAGAEKLYAQAVKLFKQGKAKYPDLKEILQKLAKEHPSSPILIDDNLKPSFVVMELAAEGRKLITVSQTHKTDFKTIQAAIKAAPPKGLIEIRDGATYEEEIIIPKEKKELILRGKLRFWPVIKAPNRGHTISVRTPGVTIQQVVVTGSVLMGADSLCLRKAIVISRDVSLMGKRHDKAKGCEVDTCFLVGDVGRGYHELLDISVRNSFIRGGMRVVNTDFHNVFVSGKMNIFGKVKLQSCTFTDGIRTNSKEFALLNSIVSYIEDSQGAVRIEHCDVFGKGYLLLAKAGKGCFSKDPGFRDPKEFDYHLKLDSPCHKKASDGGDVGLRQTPAMLEILKKALELRKKEIIKF